MYSRTVRIAPPPRPARGQGPQPFSVRLTVVDSRPHEGARTRRTGFVGLGGMEGGLTGRLMMKEVLLYVALTRELGVPSLNAAGCGASFGLANELGHGDQVSNRVVDAIGDLAGGVRLHGEPAPRRR